MGAVPASALPAHAPPFHSLPSVGGHQPHLSPTRCVLVCKCCSRFWGWQLAGSRLGWAVLPSCSSCRGGKGADAWHAAGAPQSPGFAGCLGMGLHTNFPAKYQRTSARRCRWRLKCTSVPGGMCGHRVRISCCLAASRDAGGAASGAGMVLVSSTCPSGRTVTPTSC